MALWSSLIGGLPDALGRSFNACNCVGPQNGQPVCPCRMRGLKIVNGRYVEIIDHGPAPEAKDG